MARIICPTNCLEVERIRISITAASLQFAPELALLLGKFSRIFLRIAITRPCVGNSGSILGIETLIFDSGPT